MRPFIISEIVMESSYIFEVKNITKEFPGVRALDNVTLHIRPGEIHSIIGENGAGKSTLMNIIYGILQPTSGELFFNGEKIIIDSPKRAQKLGIGFMPQELNLVPQLSVEENILLGHFPLRRKIFLDKKEQREIVSNILARIDPHIHADSLVRNLSAAHKQLVQLARAILFDTKILILDEPTSSLTFDEIGHLFDIIESFRKTGNSVIYISHRLDEVQRLSDTVTVLRDGHNVATLDPKTTTVEDMISNMIGRKAEYKNETRDYNYKDKKVVLSVKDFSRKKEFKKISFNLYEGEILGIAGLVGSGRTELAKAIYGYTVPDSGSLLIDGNKTINRHPREAIKKYLAYVPEERRQEGIFPILTVTENITLPSLRNFCRYQIINKKRLRKAVDEYISKLKIKVRSQDEKIANLSGGNQQKVIFSRCLLSGSRILILDEPTRGIDVNAKAEIHDLLRKLAISGISIIVISSELEEILSLSDRIIVMNEGEIKGELPASSASQEEILKLAFKH
jgi:ribose transport system ATP-binding protein